MTVVKAMSSGGSASHGVADGDSSPVWRLCTQSTKVRDANANANGNDAPAEACLEPGTRPRLSGISGTRSPGLPPRDLHSPQLLNLTPGRPAMARADRLDAHARPPENVRFVFKKYQKLKTQLDFDLDPGIVDPVKLIEADQVGPHWRRREVSGDHAETFNAFLLSAKPSQTSQVSGEKGSMLAFESLVVPGQALFMSPQSFLTY